MADLSTLGSLLSPVKGMTCCHHMYEGSSQLVPALNTDQSPCGMDEPKKSVFPSFVFRDNLAATLFFLGGALDAGA